MPNHVINIIEAEPSVLKALINKQGEIDFNEVMPTEKADCISTAQINLWDTQWNAYEQQIEDYKLVFLTAWSHPLPVVQTLSKLFTEQEIRVRYADEDLGYNCGKYTIKNGKIIKLEDSEVPNRISKGDHKKWFKFAFDLHYPNCTPGELGYETQDYQD
jgi:hypothetical protein